MALNYLSNTGKVRTRISGIFHALTLTLLFAAFACTPALADPVIQITQCGTVISQPGHYILANDLACGGAPVGPVKHTVPVMPTSVVLAAAAAQITPHPAEPADGIDIVADHVDLMLNGHTISGDFSGNSFGITVGLGATPGNSHVHIVGPGTVTGFVAAVVIDQVSHSSVSDVTTIDDFAGFLIGGGFVTPCAADCPSTKNDFQGNTVSISEFGFLVIGANDNTFRDNNVSNTGAGIFVAAGTGNDVRGNTASGNFVGILLAGGSATDNDITHNTAQNNSTVDLEDDNPNCDSNTWKHNTFGTATQPCIQ